MGLLAWLPGRRDARPSESAPAPEPLRRAGPAARVAYDAARIGKLTDGSRELLRICAAVQAAAAETRFQDIQHLLTHFKLALQVHVAMENARSHASLQPRIAHNKEAVDLIAAARREMNEIGFEVLKVVDAYIASPPTHPPEA